MAASGVTEGRRKRAESTEDAMHGYHGRILNVNLSSGQVAIETFDEPFARQYLGGNGFAIRSAVRASGRRHRAPGA